jgi:hypothetical protein
VTPARTRRPVVRSRARCCALFVCCSTLPACANVQPPPGGPPDAAAPQLIAAVPESLAVLPDFDQDVEFRFSEVVSEGSQPSQGLGTSDLERMVIVSPTNRIPEVRWRRRRITVRPSEGWQPDRVYRVELLPGVKDVRGNLGKERRVVTFTTGAPVPTDSLVGTVIDWKAGRPAPSALVEAVLQPDSLVYRALADSSGSFRIGPLPPGDYVVYGVIDGNNNRRREPREAFDSVRVSTDSGRAGDVYAFAHDTLPPRIQTAAPQDSVTATLTFAAPLDPGLRLDSSAVTLRSLPDSGTVRVRSLRVPEPGARTKGPAVRDSVEVGDSIQAGDSVRQRDPSRAPRTPKIPERARAGADSGRRPALNDRMLLETAAPWKPGDRFLIEVRGVRTVSGTTGDVRAPLVIPEARRAAPRTTGDSLERRETGPQPDSLPRQPDPAPPAPPAPS